MKAANTCCLVLTVASSITSPVIAFVSPPPPGCRAAAFSARALDGKKRLKEEELQLPPRDDTFNPLGRLRELLAAPDVASVGRYDRIGSLSGGTWRSSIFGYLPATVITSQQGSKWVLEQEATGNVYQAWPESFNQVMGEKALTAYGLHPKLHAISRRPFSKALSPNAVLETQPYLNAIVERKILQLEGFAKRGQEIVVQDQVIDVTVESIARVFFGDYATPEFLDDIKPILPAMARGALSVPVRFPWPLHQIPVFGFGKSMDAREAFQSHVMNLLERHRADVASSEEGNNGGKSAGLMDSLIELTQQNQMDLAGVPAFDDDFIVDNVILSLLAGTDTTAVTLTRILQLLATADDGKEIVDELLQEFSNVATSDGDELDDTTGTGSGGASRAGVLGAFPLLDAVILEAYRMHPAIPAVFRKTRVDASYNGFDIPGRTTINWNMIHGLRAESLYPEPTKFCPFRFLHGDKANDEEGVSSSANPDEVSAAQPPPSMFGLGRHICPGRELAKLVMFLFLKKFLAKFDYELVEGQSFKGVLPVNAPKDKLRVILKPKFAPKFAPYV